MSFSGNQYPNNAEKVITTQGDLVRGNSSGERERLGIGSANQVLQSNGTTESWQTLSTADSVLTTQGDILYQNASGLARLGQSTDGYVLTTKGAAANPEWAAAGGGKVIWSISCQNYTQTVSRFQPFNSTNVNVDTESYVDNTVNTALTCTRSNCNVFANSKASNQTYAFRDDGSDVGALTITASTTVDIDSGAISVSIASGSKLNYSFQFTVSGSVDVFGWVTEFDPA